MSWSWSSSYSASKSALRVLCHRHASSDQFSIVRPIMHPSLLHRGPLCYHRHPLFQDTIVTITQSMVPMIMMATMVIFLTRPNSQVPSLTRLQKGEAASARECGGNMGASRHHLWVRIPGRLSSVKLKRPHCKYKPHEPGGISKQMSDSRTTKVGVS